MDTNHHRIDWSGLCALVCLVLGILCFVFGVTSFIVKVLQEKRRNVEVVAVEQSMPSGYVLVTNSAGQWRAANEKPFVVMNPHLDESDGTKAQAIRRAWGQFNYEKERREAKWFVVPQKSDERPKD